MSLWQSFVDKFFNESGSFIHVLYSMSAERTKQFEIVSAALPRYFYTVFNTDIQNIQITLDGAKENTGSSENKVTCDRAKFIYTYENQCQVCSQASASDTVLIIASGRLHWETNSILVRLRKDGMATIRRDRTSTVHPTQCSRAALPTTVAQSDEPKSVSTHEQEFSQEQAASTA